MIRTTPLQLVLVATMLCMATAFSSQHCRNTAFRNTRRLQQQQHRRTRLVVNLADSNSNAENAENADNPLQGMELTSALARIDQEWQIQQQRAPEQSRWTKLVLPKESDNDDSADNVMEDPPLKDQSSQPQSAEEEIVYLLEPSNSYSSAPSCLIVFVGGAGLGQFPQIAYSDFLTQLSDKLNAAVLVAPYTVGLDHFELAKQTGDRLRRAIVYCQDDSKRQYPQALPVFSLSHSLGCKLQTIYVAATSQDYRGMGFLAYNNFGFGQTIQMARSFAEQLRGNNSFDKNTMGKSEDAFDMIFGLAETVLGAVGLDFSPSAKDTERLISLKFDDELQRKARLFVFDDDDLDSSEAFAQSCDNGPGPTTSGLPGTHLTPVYFKFGLEGFPEETRDMAREFAGGYESASFGDESHMTELVEEVSNWILGKDPSRPAHWKGTQAEAPRLAGIIDKD